MIDETGNHSRSHGLHPDVLRAQAEEMGLPIIMTCASWNSYEAQFKANACHFREQGIMHGVFGDIDLEQHREWVERVCRESDLTAHQPLWQSARRELVREFISTGFKAIIVVVDTNQMPVDFLGREIDEVLIGELESIGVDACGENGEFHTFVYDGPLFKRKVDFKMGSVLNIDNHWVLPIIRNGDNSSLSVQNDSGFVCA